MGLRVKRAYDTPEASDGFRVLVDRLWPRGLSKERAEIDLWAKDVAPSTELRHDWHAAGSDAEWRACADRYRAELVAEHAAALDQLTAAIKDEPVVTLLYAFKDAERSHAHILADTLRERLA